MVAVGWAMRTPHAGLISLGAVPTALGCLFANDALVASEAVGGSTFSRATLLFVAWLLVRRRLAGTWGERAWRGAWRESWRRRCMAASGSMRLRPGNLAPPTCHPRHG